MPDDVVPFRPEVTAAELDDLRDRLRRARWPDPATVTDWSQGVPLDYLRDLCNLSAKLAVRRLDAAGPRML